MPRRRLAHLGRYRRTVDNAIMVILAWIIAVAATIIIAALAEVAESRKAANDILSAKLRGERTQTQLLTGHVEMLDGEVRRIHALWVEAIRERDEAQQASPAKHIFGVFYEN